MKPIPYGKQEITQEDINSVVNTLNGDYLTQGPKVQEFEAAFANRIGANHAVACTNGTAALHLSAMALEVGRKSHYITTPITFVASANCILYCGGKISFCDIDPQTGLMDLNRLEAMISQKPKKYYSGIIAVHLAGYPINMEKLKKICDANGMDLIEDACHAPGGYFHDSKGTLQNCGNGHYASASIFSFHPVKHIATGEGGMITTNDPAVLESLKLLRTHGITKDPTKMTHNDGPWYYEMQELGFNYRMPDILCALGMSQLKRLDESLQKRHKIAKNYDEAFSSHSDLQPLTPQGTEKLKQEGVFHAHHLYIVKTSKRDELFKHLADNNIHAQVHYIPIYKLPFYEEMGFSGKDCPQSEIYYKTALSLPMYPSLTEDQQDYVIRIIQDFFKS